MKNEFKKVSWLELFYDLAFVALVAQLTYSVAEYHSSLEHLFLVFLAGYLIFLAWLGTTIDRNVQKSETTRDTLLIQLQMVLAFGMSITLPGIFVGILWPFFLSYALIRVVQMYMRILFFKENPEWKPNTHNILGGMAIATALWAIAGFVAAPYVYVLAGLLLVLEILTPLTRGKGNTLTLLNIPHLQERFGLFLILVIGESMLVVALTNTVVGLDFAHPLIVLNGIILMIALWWSYFGYIERCATNERPKNLIGLLHTHAFLFGGVVLLAAAFKNFLKHDSLYLSDHLLFVSGVVVVTCTLIFIRNILAGKATLRTGAMRATLVGIPLIGYLGWLTNAPVYATTLLTTWVVLLAVYDEWHRCRK